MAVIALAHPANAIRVVPVVACGTVCEEFARTNQVCELAHWWLRIFTSAAVQVSEEDATMDCVSVRVPDDVLVSVRITIATQEDHCVCERLESWRDPAFQGLADLLQKKKKGQQSNATDKK